MLKAEIKFIHKDGKEYHFVTERNNLSGNQMFSYNNWLDCFASDLKEVKTIMQNIKKKAVIISEAIDNNHPGRF